MFRPRSTTSRTSPSPTQWSFVPSQKPGREVRLEPSSSLERGAQAVISAQMPDGTLLTIITADVTISFDRDFVDVTSWNDANKTYLVDKGTFTIKGKL